MKTTSKYTQNIIMFTETIVKCANNAKRILNLLNTHSTGFYISSAMAGAYVGLAVILVVTLGNGVEPGLRPLIMGATFGLALTLVIFAGSELFTGHVMYTTFGIKAGTVTVKDALKILPQTWFGNLLGSITVALLYTGAWTGIMEDGNSTLHQLALAKTTAPWWKIFVKGMLCNYLVCLAIWITMRVEGSAKFIAIWWCLLGFIGSGYEHSVANMTLLTLSYIGNHNESLTVAGIVKNLFWATAGNIVSGVVFMGLGYWYATDAASRPKLS